MTYGAAYENARILVTGASGFIGSKLCTRLLQAGARVTALAKEGQVPEVDESDWCRLDISNYAEVEACFRKHKPDVVFNAAALVTGNRSIDVVSEITEVNLTGAINVMRAALKTTRPRVVLCGSMEEAPPEEIDETPFSPYAAAKHASRLYARMFNEQHDLDVVMTRIFMVYGPGQNDSSKLIPYVIEQLLDNQRPQISAGVRRVDWIYVDDVVDALLRLGIAEDVSGNLYDIGSGKQATIQDVVNILCRLLHSETEPEFGAVEDRGSETEYFAEWGELRDATGWNPQTSLEDGLNNTIEWVRSMRQFEQHTRQAANSS